MWFINPLITQSGQQIIWSRPVKLFFPSRCSKECLTAYFSSCLFSLKASECSNNNVKRATAVMLTHSLTHSLTTRQWVTGARIPDVWKIMAQGAAGIAQQSIKQHACGGGQTALWFHFFFTWFENGRAWKQVKWSYWHNTYKLAPQPLGLYWKRH